jgi:predicted nucleotidyltransferase
MDFKVVFEKLLIFFHENNVRYALIGDFALGVHGVSRSTLDIDFLVHIDDLPKIDVIMNKLGYNCAYRSENVSQFISPLKVFGEVDFIHAFRDISVKMLQRVEGKNILNDTVSVKVLRVEDIIGFKVQAMANDESRKALDLADIESLMNLHKSSIDWDILEEYFSLFKLSGLFAELKGKYFYVE